MRLFSVPRALITQNVHDFDQVVEIFCWFWLFFRKCRLHDSEFLTLPMYELSRRCLDFMGCKYNQFTKGVLV